MDWLAWMQDPEPEVPVVYQLGLQPYSGLVAKWRKTAKEEKEHERSCLVLKQSCLSIESGAVVSVESAARNRPEQVARAALFCTRMDRV